MANYMTFKDIYQAVQRGIKDESDANIDLIKHVINQVYLTEILNADDLYPLYFFNIYIRRRWHAPKNITNISQAIECEITVDAPHNFLEKEIISLWDIEGMVELNYDNNDTYPRFLGFYMVHEVTAAAAFTISDQNDDPLDSTILTAYTTGGRVFHHGYWHSDWIKDIRSVGLYNQNPLTRISINEFMKSPDSYFSNQPGIPSYFFCLQAYDGAGVALNELLTWPGSDNDYIGYLEFEGIPDKLENDTDVPAIPMQFHPALVSGAITRLAESNVQVENQVVWPALYERHLDALRTYNHELWKRALAETKKRPYGLL